MSRRVWRGWPHPAASASRRMVRDQIRDKLPYPFEDMGEHNVKNIARPVRVYSLRADGLAGALPANVPSGASHPLPIAAPRLSIVVLPFANMSGDPEQQYFADGITKDLTRIIREAPG